MLAESSNSQERGSCGVMLRVAAVAAARANALANRASSSNRAAVAMSSSRPLIFRTTRLIRRFSRCIAMGWAMRRGPQRPLVVGRNCLRTLTNLRFAAMAHGIHWLPAADLSILQRLVGRARLDAADEALDVPF